MRKKVLVVYQFFISKMVTIIMTTTMKTMEEVSILHK